MSVPAHAPYDFQALEDIKNGNQENIEDSLRMKLNRNSTNYDNYYKRIWRNSMLKMS